MLKKIVKRLLQPFLERRRLNQWAASIASSKKEKGRIIEDYKVLFNTKGLTPDEYRDFEFEKQPEDMSWFERATLLFRLSKSSKILFVGTKQVFSTQDVGRYWRA